MDQQQPRTPRVATRESVPYVGIAEHVPMTAVGRVGRHIGTLMAWIGEHGLAPAGPPFFRYHVIDMDRELLVEAGVPLRGGVDGLPASPAPDGEIAAGALPAGRYAVVVHHGHPDELVGATADLLAWAAQQGLRFEQQAGDDGEAWACRVESYLSDPAEVPDMADWDTELAFKLAD